MKLKNILSIAAIATASIQSQAIELPAIIGSNMVVQQKSDALLWGWSKANEKVKVTTSWNNKTYAINADSNGRWQVRVATPEASYTPHTIKFSDKASTIVADNVLVGEVWFCSGQSNMQMPLNGFWMCPVAGANQAIAYSGKYTGKIRFATIPTVCAAEPLERVEGDWKECNPANAPWFSAVGYFFARSLNDIIDIPIGIINCSWGGSKVEGWLPKKILQEYPDVDLSVVNDPNYQEYYKPMIMYNGMLRPVAGYTIKGFLWNQGESNVGAHNQYPSRLGRMVKHWRELWGNDALPFYQVEIPPHNYQNATDINAAQLRDAQHIAAKTIPHSGIVCTSDLTFDWEAYDIHPSTKQPIGERLAFMAACENYGLQGVAYKSPTFNRAEYSGNTATLYFNDIPEGLTPSQGIKGFEVAGEDGIFYPTDNAQQFQEPFRVVLTSNKVNNIVAVRYCYKNWAKGSVFSSRGLPLVPFRTDNWDK